MKIILAAAVAFLPVFALHQLHPTEPWSPERLAYYGVCAVAGCIAGVVLRWRESR